MTCANCKTSNPDTARFCLQCGTQLPADTLSQVVALNGEVTQVTQIEKDAAVDNCDNLLGRTIAGKYRLDMKLGAGGMGSVYRATRVMIGDEVAVKILHSDQTDSKAAERFQREAKAAARLKNLHAVAIYDFGITEEGLQYLVMELVEGESLRQILKREGPLTSSASAEIITQVSAALDEAHRHNITHRDVKPDNIVVNTTAHGLRVKVLDFGIAKLRDDSAGNLTQTGSILGTPHYMSPEQCLGEELDGRSDVYSLGVVAYEMLTGLVPFNSPTSSAVVVQHVTQPPVALRALNAGITSAAEKVVLHALEKQRQARPQTAGEFASMFSKSLDTLVRSEDQLHELRFSLPPQSGPSTVVLTRPTASTGEVAKTSSRRNPWLYVAMGFGVVFLVGLGLFLFRPWRHENPSAASAQSTSLKTTTLASSARLTSGGVNYGAANIVDGNLGTAWDEGVSGAGIGEWIQCDFDSETAVVGIRVAPGYFKTSRLWHDNNRLAAGTLSFSDGTSRTLTFTDQMREQAFEIGIIKTRWVRLRIDRVYPGMSDTEDTPISEISFILQGQFVPAGVAPTNTQATEVPLPRPSPQPPEQGSWFVVLGSFPKSDYAKAAERMQVFQRTSYSPSIIDTDNYPGLKSGFWAVVMGPYSQPSAKKIAAEMRSLRSDVYIKSGR